MEKISAMIFAAGLGTRLYPLTADKPKALVEYKGIPLLEHAIRKLISAGIEHIVINVHHFANQIVRYLETHSFDATIEISDETAQLLDTAGGLKKASCFFEHSDHILLYNVDIISSINITDLIQNHMDQNHLATLAAKERITSRHLIVDRKTMKLCGWDNTKTGELIWVNSTLNPLYLGFSGIHIVRKAFLNFIPENQKISFTPLYLELAKKNPIYTFLHNQDVWKDMGKIEDFTN